MTGKYTRLINPVATTNPPVQTDAPTAYMQILSYAGSAAHRDPIDKRIINTVIRQNGAHLDSQDQVGGWYYPATTNIAIDPDGLPDAWKIAQGLDPDDDTIGRQKPVPGGYTYLEMYLHELNASFQPPSSTQQTIVSTAFGDGADATISENNGLAGGDGAGGSLAARWTDSAAGSNEYVELRFDLSQIKRGTIADATLELTAFQSMTGQTLRVYGLEHSIGNQDWDEATIDFNTAPGVDFDGNSVTRGRVADELLLLGEFSTGAASEGDAVNFANPDLTAFLNLLAYRDGGPEDVVTLLLERQNTSSSQALFASKEAAQLATGFAASAGTYAPRLLLDATLAAIVPTLAGDYNQDGTVDAADYSVWRDNVGGNGPLPNETASLGTIDQADYDAWKANFGATNANNGGGAASATVPEPATTTLILFGMLASVSNLGPRRR
jgi:hypothetical protein